MASVYDWREIKIDKTSLGKLMAKDGNNTDRMMAILGAWLASIKADLRIDDRVLVRPKDPIQDQNPAPTPDIPKEIKANPQKVNRTLDRILREHGIEQKRATDAQKKFYMEFINPDGNLKSQEEIAKMVQDKIKADKTTAINPNLKDAMDKMVNGYTRDEGAGLTSEGNLVDCMTETSSGLPHDMMPASHLVMIGSKIPNISAKDGQLRDTMVPHKQDLSTMGLEGYIMLATNMMYSQEKMSDLGKMEYVPKANSLMDNIIETYATKDVSMARSADTHAEMRDSREVFAEASKQGKRDMRQWRESVKDEAEAMGVDRDSINRMRSKNLKRFIESRREEERIANEERYKNDPSARAERDIEKDDLARDAWEGKKSDYTAGQDRGEMSSDLGQYRDNIEQYQENNEMIDYINKNIQKDNSSPEVKAEYMREVDAMMAQNAQIKQQNKQIVDKYSQTFAHNRNPEEEMEQ